MLEDHKFSRRRAGAPQILAAAYWRTTNFNGGVLEGHKFSGGVLEDRKFSGGVLEDYKF